MINNHWLDVVVDLMNTLHDETGVIVNKFGIEPTENSIAAKELIAFDNQEKLLTAYYQGSLMIEVVMDHFSSLARLITQPVHTISPWTTIRSMLESSAIGLWLLDSKINVDDRIHRSIKFRCEGLKQQVKFGRTITTEDNIESSVNRYIKVMLEGEELGLDLIRSESGEIKQLRNEMPSMTNLISMFLDMEAEYRLFSAIAHAHPWALQQLSFSKVDPPNSLLLEKNLPIELIQYFGNFIFKISCAPAIEKCKLYGWPHQDISAIFQNSERLFSETINGVIGQ